MPRRPNILLITSDQHRADTLGCAGHPCVRTPHLDMLAAMGTRFTQAHTDCASCAPARTTLMTGIQAHRYGCPRYDESFRIARRREHFLGSLMTAAGYQTCLAGKSGWHTDPHFRGGFETWVPLERQEAEVRRRLGTAALTGIGGNEMEPMLSPVPEELNSSHWVVDRSVEWLSERERDRPFFLWASLIEPHPPNQVHEPYYSMYADADVPEPVQGDWAGDATCPLAIRRIRSGNSHSFFTPHTRRRARGVYYGMTTHMDHQVGRLIGALWREGLWDNTAIVYTSDHGDHLGDQGTFFKGTMLEGAVHVPMIARLPEWMGGPRPAAADAVVGLVDLLPTFCEWAGAPTPDDVAGHSLAPLFAEPGDRVRDLFHGQTNGQHMLLDGRYKYLYFVDDGRELLFDKPADPLEEHDLAARQPDLAAAFRERLAAHLREERHEHLLADGRLLNRGETFTAEDRTNILGWMGLASQA